MTPARTPSPLAGRSLRAPVLWGVVFGVLQAALILRIILLLLVATLSCGGRHVAASDGELARPLAGRVRERVVGQHGPPDVDETEDEEHDDGQDERRVGRPRHDDPVAFTGEPTAALKSTPLWPRPSRRRS